MSPLQRSPSMVMAVLSSLSSATISLLRSHPDTRTKSRMVSGRWLATWVHITERAL